MVPFPGHGSIRVLLLFALSVLCVFGLLAPAAQAQSLPLYTVSKSDDLLRTVDPLTGQTLTIVTIALPPQLELGTVIGANGLARHPVTGDLYAVLTLQGQFGRELVTIDPTTGDATDIGNTGLLIAGIAFLTESTVTLYAVTGDGDEGGAALYVLDLLTAQADFKQALGNGSAGETIASNPVDGLLYHASGCCTPNLDQIFETIAPASQEIVNVPLSVDVYSEATALTYWGGNFFLLGDLGESNRLYLVNRNGRVRVLSTLDHIPKGLAFAGSPPTCPPLAPLYGAANLGPDGPSLFYSLDPASGAPTLIGPIGFERVSGIAFNASGTLFGTGERQEGSNTSVLMTIDPCTGTGTEVGPTRIGLLEFSTITDISFSPSVAEGARSLHPQAAAPAAGTLFAVLAQPPTLGTLDTSTGQATVLGGSISEIGAGNGLAFSPSGILYHADDQNLNQLDPDTGSVTLPIPLTFPGSTVENVNRVNAMDFQPGTGVLFASVGGVVNYLGTIDTATGIVSFFETEGGFTQTQRGLDAIAFSPAAGTGVPATITTGGGSGSQSTVIHTPFPLPLQATVKDSGGIPVPGVTVTFTVPGSGPSGTFPGEVLSVQVTTDASGIATSPTLTANGTVGSYTAAGTVTGIDTPANYSLTNTLGPGATITTSGGSGSQSTPIHTAFPLPLQATVKDSGGTPVPGVAVTFTVPGSGPSGTFPGGVLSVQVTTDATGTATSPTLTANGTVGGPYLATGTVELSSVPDSPAANGAVGGPHFAPLAAAGSATANYSLTNTLSAGATITTGGGSGSQSTPINTAFPLPLQATVKDSGGIPVPGVPVTFTAPGSGPSATFPGGVLSVQVTTDGSGVATSPTLTANSQAGSYLATGTVTGIATPANYSLTNTPGPPNTITATGGTPQRANVNTAFTAALQATVKDSGGNPVPGATVTFTAPGSGASGAFAGGANTAVTNASGVATSTTFTANSTSGIYNVNATVPGVETSAAFALTNVDFSVASATGTQTVAAGGTANYSLNFTAIVDKSVNPTTFACQNLPASATCAFNPASLPADSGNTPFGLGISTTARPSTAASIASGGGFGLPLGVLPAAVLALLAMIAMSLASFSKRAPRFARSRVAAFGLLVLMVGYIAGCGAVGTGFPAAGTGGAQGTPAGTYSVTVVATSGGLQRTTTVSLTVQ